MIEAIVAMAAVTFITRAAGLWGIPVRAPVVLRALGLVPVSAFAVLVAAGLEARPGAWSRWVVVFLGGWLSWRGLPIWVCVGLGMAIHVAGSLVLR